MLLQFLHELIGRIHPKTMDYDKQIKFRSNIGDFIVSSSNLSLIVVSFRIELLLLAK